MISDADVLAEVRKSWNGVEGLRGKVQRAFLGAVARGGVAAIFFVDAAHNVPFIHACAVLNDVLEQLQKEGHFNCNSFFLTKLVRSSKSHLPWNDLPLVEEAVKRRNNIAHRADVLPRGDCWRFIDGIRSELESWKILDARSGQS
jgi:hypothetical protein